MTGKTQRGPNVLITGTPGTGKSTLAQVVVSLCPQMKYINVGDWIKEKDLHDGRDEEFDAFILNEDKVCDEMEDPVGGEGRCVVDFHSCDFFPERWFDLVVVLRSDIAVLHPRLEKRGYAPNKVSENVTCEIMQVVLEEAVDSYKKEIVWELQSDTTEQMEENAQKVINWLEEKLRE
eukprot:TRINITY_DN15256_c0_g1_i1.p1 TRINITY_DN15256_c0_g1~~TRINITY_DN15256_c0_g1_i1.p1  ORF type:complete len:187 (+),score=74.97 TRINITY_DN15256_c0_g1_i1:31-561(+)